MTARILKQDTLTLGTHAEAICLNFSRLIVVLSVEKGPRKFARFRMGNFCFEKDSFL